VVSYRFLRRLYEKVNLKVIRQNIWGCGEATPPYILAGTSQSPLLRQPPQKTTYPELTVIKQATGKKSRN
jgi:hypothetical protein